MRTGQLNDGVLVHPFACHLESRATLAESLAAVLGGRASEAAKGAMWVATVTAAEPMVSSREYMRRLIDDVHDSVHSDAQVSEYIRVRESAFHPARFDPKERVVSPCESVYVAEDPETHAGLLRSLYAAHGFHPHIATERCCPGHVSVELEFYGNELRLAAQNAEAIAVAREFLSAHLLRWAPLFAAVVSGRSWHPVLRLAGLSLEQFFREEAMLARARVGAAL